MPKGRRTAATVVEAVNATERLICNDGAVHGAAVAEGLALAGRRAATLLDPAVRDVAGDGPTSAVPWVHHRIRAAECAEGGRAAFELVAADAQEAIDHCLVARRLAAALGLPGVCTLDAETSTALAVVRLPEAGMIEQSLRDIAVASSRPAALWAVSGAVILEQAEQALAAVTRLTGRETSAVRTHGMDAARFALIASGEATQRALAAAAALRSAGAPCGVVVVSLLRPFPAERLRRALSEVRAVAVVQLEISSDRSSELLDRVRDALGADRRISLHAVSPGGDGELRLPTEVSEAFDLPLDLDPSSRSGRDEASPSVSLGFSPRGPFGERLLLDVAALLGGLRPIRLRRDMRNPAGLTALALAREVPRSARGGGLDHLFVAHPSIPGRRWDANEADALNDGAALVLYSTDDSPEAMWSALDGGQRKAIQRRNLRVFWWSPAGLGSSEPLGPGALGWALRGAVIAATPQLGSLVGAADEALNEICSLDPADAPSVREAELLRAGARGLVALDLERLDAALGKNEKDFRPASRGLPRMPQPVEQAPEPKRSAIRRSLRRFHMTGRGSTSIVEPLQAVPLRPAVLSGLAAAREAWRVYPVARVAGDATSGWCSLHELLAGALERVSQDGTPPTILETQIRPLLRAASRTLEGAAAAAPLGGVLDEALQRLLDELDASAAGRDELRREIARLATHLPAAGELLGLGRNTLLTLFAETLRKRRRPRTTRFREEARGLVQRLTDQLRLDDSHAPEARTPGAISSTLGVGANFLDPQALSRNLPEHHGSRRMDPARRQRIEAARDRLRAYLDDAEQRDDLVLVRTPATGSGAGPQGCRVLYHDDGLASAIGLFDGLAQEMVETIKAVRTARLESDGSYDPALHDEVIARTSWRSFTAEELLLLPPVVVLETGRRLRGTSLASFSVLLRSGRPVYVLVEESTADLHAGETWEALAGYHPGLGYLAVAHREPFVLQTTLARPEHLVAGVEQMVDRLHPAVAIVGVPTWDAPVAPWLQLVGAQQSRTTPCFRYDPLAGETWAERFDLEDNPQAERAWPEYDVAYLDESGNETSRPDSFTFAHAAAIDPAYRSHFRALDRQAWDDDQSEIADWLRAGEAEQRRRVPFLWIVNERGELARAIVTRELAFACRDRMRAWRILQELAGTRNEYALRAARAARAEAQAASDERQRRLEAAHAAELERVRSTAAGEAMERLAAVLMDLDSASISTPVSRPSVTAPSAPMPAPAAEAAPREAVAEPEDEDEISFDEPYIDSVLCTTCNECTNLNPRLFAYNDNRQATIADATAGTFEQLVKAAEKCPARCIHPGAPRADDETATAKLINRAKAFH